MTFRLAFTQFSRRKLELLQQTDKKSECQLNHLQLNSENTTFLSLLGWQIMGQLIVITDNVHTNTFRQLDWNTQIHVRNATLGNFPYCGELPAEMSLQTSCCGIRLLSILGPYAVAMLCVYIWRLNHGTDCYYYCNKQIRCWAKQTAATHTNIQRFHSLLAR